MTPADPVETATLAASVTPPLTKRGEAKAARRREMLDAAARQMAARGFAGVRLEERRAAGWQTVSTRIDEGSEYLRTRPGPSAARRAMSLATFASTLIVPSSRRRRSGSCAANGSGEKPRASMTMSAGTSKSAPGTGTMSRRSPGAASVNCMRAARTPPSPVPPEEWEPLVWGGKAPKWGSAEEAQEVQALLAGLLLEEVLLLHHREGQVGDAELLGEAHHGGLRPGGPRAGRQTHRDQGRGAAEPDETAKSHETATCHVFLLRRARILWSGAEGHDSLVPTAVNGHMSYT